MSSIERVPHRIPDEGVIKRISCPRDDRARASPDQPLRTAPCCQRVAIDIRTHAVHRTERVIDDVYQIINDIVVVSASTKQAVNTTSAIQCIGCVSSQERVGV